MVSHKELARALKYRRLALIEPDGQIALLLRKLADEAERGVLAHPIILHSVVPQVRCHGLFEVPISSFSGASMCVRIIRASARLSAQSDVMSMKPGHDVTASPYSPPGDFRKEAARLGGLSISARVGAPPASDLRITSR